MFLSKYNIIYQNPILFENNDTRIIVSAYVYAENHNDVIFVTDDLNCNNIARALGLSTKDLIDKEDNSYTGYKIYTCVRDNDIAELYNRIYEGDHFGLFQNEYLVIQHNNSVIDSYVLKNNKLEQVQFTSFKSKMLGEIKPLDPYQKLAMNSLKNNTITMLRGGAGAGKSHLGLGFLFDRLEQGYIDKIIIFCNTVATKGSAKLGLK